MHSFLHLPNYILNPKILLKNHLFYKIMPDLSSSSIWIHAVITVVTSLVTLPSLYCLHVCVYVAHIYTYVYAHTHQTPTQREREREKAFICSVLAVLSYFPGHCLSFVPGFTTILDLTKHSTLLATNYPFIYSPKETLSSSHCMPAGNKYHWLVGLRDLRSCLVV